MAFTFLHAADLHLGSPFQGLASRENVLEARHALLQARLNLAEAEAQNGVQVVAVYKALGGGSLPSP